MKKLIFTHLLFLTVSCNFIFAQNFTISDQKSKTEEGQECDSWVAHLDQPIDYAKKTFEKYIKANFDRKLEDKNKTVLFLEKSKFADISSLRGDLRAVYSPEGTGCMVGFIFSPGYDIHLTKQNFPEEFKKMETLVRKYVKFHYIEYYKEMIADIDKQITKKENEITSNEKKIQSKTDDIADNETKINAGDKKADKLKDRNIKNNGDIVTLQTGITTLQAEIVKLRETVNKGNESLKKVYEFQ